MAQTISIQNFIENKLDSYEIKDNCIKDKTNKQITKIINEKVNINSPFQSMDLYMVDGVFISVKNLKNISCRFKGDYVPEGCFFGCEDLEEVILRDINNIEPYAFHKCKKLKKITIYSAPPILKLNKKLLNTPDYNTPVVIPTLKFQSCSLGSLAHDCLIDIPFPTELKFEKGFLNENSNSNIKIRVSGILINIKDIIV